MSEKSEAAERFETWGAHRTAKPNAYLYSSFPQCPLRSFLAQANLFAILTLVVKGAQMADFLASDWSSDVRSHVMVGNRGPGGKKGSLAHRKSHDRNRK